MPLFGPTPALRTSLPVLQHARRYDARDPACSHPGCGGGRLGPPGARRHLSGKLTHGTRPSASSCARPSKVLQCVQVRDRLMSPPDEDFSNLSRKATPASPRTPHVNRRRTASADRALEVAPDAPAHGGSQDCGPRRPRRARFKYWSPRSKVSRSMAPRRSYGGDGLSERGGTRSPADASEELHRATACAGGAIETDPCAGPDLRDQPSHAVS